MSSSRPGFISLTTAGTAPTDAANAAVARSKSHAATNIRDPPDFKLLLKDAGARIDVAPPSDSKLPAETAN